MTFEVGPELAAIIMAAFALVGGGTTFIVRRKSKSRSCSNCGRRLGFKAYYCSSCLYNQLKEME